MSNVRLQGSAERLQKRNISEKVCTTKSIEMETFYGSIISTMLESLKAAK
jgi:hypothetical protein